MKKELYQIIQNHRYLDLIGFDDLPVCFQTKEAEYNGVSIQYLDLERSIKDIIVDFIKKNPEDLDKAIQVISFVANCVEGYQNLDIARLCCINKIKKTTVKKKYLNRTLYGYVILAPLFVEGFLKGQSLDEIIIENQIFIPKTRDCVSPVKITSYSQKSKSIVYQQIQDNSPIDVFLLPLLNGWNDDLVNSHLERKLFINWHFFIKYYVDISQCDDTLAVIAHIQLLSEKNNSLVKVSFGISELSRMFDFLFFEYQNINDIMKKDKYKKTLMFLFKDILRKIFKDEVSTGIVSCCFFDQDHYNYLYLKQASNSIYSFFLDNQDEIIKKIKHNLFNWSIFFENIGISEISKLKLINDFKNNHIKQLHLDSRSRFNFWTEEPELNLFTNSRLKKIFLKNLEKKNSYDENWVNFIFLLHKTVPKLDQQLLIPYAENNHAYYIMSELSPLLWMQMKGISTRPFAILMGLEKIFNTYSHKKILRMLLMTKTNSNILIDTLSIFNSLDESEYPVQSSFSSIHELHELLKIIQLKKNTKVRSLNQEEIDYFNGIVVVLNNEEYKIKIPKTNYDLIIGGEILKNCVGIYNYTDKIISKQSFVFFIEKNNEYYACLEIVSCLNKEEQDQNGYYHSLKEISSHSSEFLDKCFYTEQSVLWGNVSWDLWPKHQYFKVENKKIQFLNRQDVV